MKELIIPLILFFILIGLLIIIRTIRKTIMKESFANDNNYLYPIKGLSLICKKDNLLPSYMPKACYIDGKLNSYANCKCEDPLGNCKICYPSIEKDSHNASVIYSAP
jgi:hypothetical protein